MSKSLNGAIDFLSDEAGSVTPFGLFFGLTTLMLGGLAIDMSNLVAVRTQAQVAADIAAHAAIYTREFEDADEAKAKALELVEASFPYAQYGTLVNADNIFFGSFNSATGDFTEDSGSDSGVMVYTDRSIDRGNPVSSFLLQLVGNSTFDVAAMSVFQGAVHPCLRDGWVAEGIVDAQSNNDFYSGFCVHSNEHVEFNNNNYFETGVTVSMPDKTDLVIPSSGFSKNEGLEAALRSGTINLRILSHISDILDNLGDPDSKFYRSYLDSTIPIYMGGSKLETSDFTAGRIHVVDCTLPAGSSEASSSSETAETTETTESAEESSSPGKSGDAPGKSKKKDDTDTSDDTSDDASDDTSDDTSEDTSTDIDLGDADGKLTIDASGTVLSEVVIMTSCTIKFSNGSMLENAVIFTSNTDDKSITSSQGLVLGKDDNCDPDGSVQIVTNGGFEVAAKLEIYSSQVIALGPIQFAAQGDGIEGGSFISGETIDGTSNTAMGSCPAEGMEENFAVNNFSMSR